MLTCRFTLIFSLQDGDGFKRFSVSVGALHVMPQGKVNLPSQYTSVKDGETAKLEISKHKRCSTISSQDLEPILLKAT